ncbi:hypothetical protein [Geobacter sp. FeAm09]|uniref:hypothetical protein n=1 Tax=Geobacter sp. FeAm09 TaxID=2597769 RepID=UPI001F0EDAE7|nr:hypothetical protein [Geobacter sp. FeAm09]
MTRKPALILCLIGSCLVQLIVVAPSHAIPAFSRAYKVECSTCHTIYPELNEYGEAFLKNSYVYFGKGQKGAKAKEATPPPAPAPGATTRPAGGALEVKGEGDADKLSKLKAGAMGASDVPTPQPAPEAAAQAAPPRPRARPSPKGSSWRPSRNCCPYPSPPRCTRPTTTTPSTNSTSRRGSSS